ncbi:MAG: type II toxin-antitoxin system RelE/ParE family toxin [Alkalimonas sp.]|nr:type II toxin-antitoxin system RelE/ParE family toxin [Alkalimonas sp.]
MPYRLSELAEQDLIDIFLYGAKTFGVKEARRYHQQFTRTFEFLAEHPKAAPLRQEINPPVRIHPIGQHLVIYQQVADHCIFIIRIRHGHEDWLNKEL